MNEPVSQGASQQTQKAEPVDVLPYATPTSGRLVRLSRYGTADEAELHAAELTAEGIPAQVFNANVNGLGLPYTGFTDVELHVPAEDLERAAAVLARNGDELEPEPEPLDAPPLLDEQGRALRLVPVATFDNVRLLREAHTLLSSARLRAFLPNLVPRGDRPPGEGKRFILRVSEDDAEPAKALLQDEDGDEDDLRCPSCKSWRVYPVGHFWKSIAAQVGLGPKPQDQLECLACGHRGPKEAFAPGGVEAGPAK